MSERERENEGAFWYRPSHKHFNLSGAIDSSFVLGAGYLFSIAWMETSFGEDEEGGEEKEGQDMYLS